MIRSVPLHSEPRTDRINAGLKLAVAIALPVLFGLWLGLGILGSVLVALGYGFFTPWISTFEAFRQESETKKFVHGITVRSKDMNANTIHSMMCL